MVVFRAIFFLLCLFDCSASVLTLGEVVKLGGNDYKYSMFYNSMNDCKKILASYKAAVTSCKSSLNILDRKPRPRGLYPCSASVAKGVEMWKGRLECLVNEKEMLKMVQAGHLKNYIYDTVKNEVFDKKSKSIGVNKNEVK